MTILPLNWKKDSMRGISVQSMTDAWKLVFDCSDCYCSETNFRRYDSSCFKLDFCARLFQNLPQKH